MLDRVENWGCWTWSCFACAACVALPSGCALGGGGVRCRVVCNDIGYRQSLRPCDDEKVGEVMGGCGKKKKKRVYSKVRNNRGRGGGGAVTISRKVRCLPCRYLPALAGGCWGQEGFQVSITKSAMYRHHSNTLESR